MSAATAARAQDVDVEALVLRRAHPHDADAIVELYDQLSRASSYARFHGPRPHIDSATRTRLTSLDGAVVWLAFDLDRCVGEARVVRSLGEACAELAVTIADRYQNRALGFRLAKLAVEEHLRTGDCVTFTTMADNGRVARLARANAVPLRLEDGILYGRITATTIRA